MKRLLLIISLGIMGCNFNPGSCQTNRFVLALEGGPGISYLYGISMPEGDMTITPILAGTVGMSFQYAYTTHWSLKAGLQYERKGTYFKYESYGFMTDFLCQFDYLTIPLLLQAEYGRKVRFYFNAGMYFSYLLIQKYSNRFENSEYVEWVPENPDGSAMKNKKFDFGLCAEAGTKITLSKKIAISIGVCDHLGLYNTEKQPLFTQNNGNPANDVTTSFNNVIYLVAGCSFKLITQ
jgi:putative salt-induced outer membrane protein YdiY